MYIVIVTYGKFAHSMATFWITWLQVAVIDRVYDSKYYDNT